MKQLSVIPTQKLVAASLAGAVTIIFTWATKQFAGIEIPTEVAQAITIIVSAIVGYLVPPAERDSVEANP